jgi:tetratricopeptide (TPR) repeat protein
MEKLDRGTPDFEWLKAEMLFHAWLAQVWFGSRVSGAAKIFGSYRRIREHRQLHPEFWQNLKLAGMFNVMFDFIPTWMRRAADMFGLSGNSVLGMYQIETYCDSAAGCPGLAEEGILIAGLGYKMNQQELKGMDFLQRQPAGVMENTLIRYLYASAATYTYQNDLALEILGGIRENDLQMRFYSLDYITGRCMLNKLEPGANVPLERYLADYPGQDYRKDICFRLSCYYLIRGNLERYRHYHELIATTGETMRDRDQEALLEYRSGVVPHTDLLRARLLCDGGYYDRALAELSAIDPPELTETAHRLEFHYRKGRIYQQSGRNAEAIAELTRAYGNGKSLPYTFATRAALNLGRIYEESGDYRLAFDWYEHASRAWSEEHSAESVKDAAERGMERVKGKF